MSASPARFLLDQNFPQPRMNVRDLDSRVAYVHLHDFSKKLASSSTPDWYIYLAASEAGFAGLVTHDRNQLGSELCLTALSCTDLSLVTWTTSVQDSVTAWAQLVAFMPLIQSRIEELGPSIFQLPAPRLNRKDHIRKPEEAMGELASTLGISRKELRDRSLRFMRADLKNRGDDRLRRLLD